MTDRAECDKMVGVISYQEENFLEVDGWMDLL